MTEDRLAPFVPRLALELAPREGSFWTSVDGSMLSADISGFTALSEKLAGKGKAGAEEITVLINLCFDGLIQAAYRYGGEVLKFGGDALLVLFRGNDHERRAAHAGLAMQSALRTLGAARRANLTMTVGISSGPFDTFLAGSLPRDLIITGAAASMVIELEGAAAKGETLAHPDIAALLDPELVGGSHSGGVILTGEPTLPPSGFDARPTDEHGFDVFMPPAVVEQLDAFDDLGGEHRLVTVCFLMATGISEALAEAGPDQLAKDLGHLVDGVNTAVASCGAAALHTDIATDGFKFVLCAGAPLTVGDTSDAILRAALEIAEIDSPLTLRQGVQTGRAFAGFLGNTHRRTYTLMGDVVNTAARMLGKAGHREIVAVADVLDDTRASYSSTPLEPFLVKGKSEPIVAHVVHGAEHDVGGMVADHRVTIRPDEIALVSGAISETGRVVEITGGPGSGKSRVVGAALDEAWSYGSPFILFRGVCPQFSGGTPYGVARPLFRSGFGFDAFADGSYAGETLTKIVAEAAPELAPMLPLLAIPFGADVPDTPEAAAIGEAFRRARMHDAVVELLDSASSGPLVFLVEDIQWIDDGSRELIEHLARVSVDHPWTVLVTRRDVGASLDIDEPHMHRLTLGPVSDAELRRLAIDTAQGSLSNEALDAVVSRAGGNPLFAVELTRAVGRGGSELPDSVERLFATRIDDLPPEARRVVRLASVFGQRFDGAALRAVLGAAASDIEHPALAEIVERTSTGGWTFSQSLYRDAAYEGLPYASRRTVHGRVADHLETKAAASIADSSAVLSWHFAEARSHRKAWAYARIAGDHAMRLSSPVEAIEAYDRALDAGRWPTDVTRRQRSQVATLLGDAAELAGRYEVAIDAYSKARTLLATDDHERLPLFRKQGQINERQGRYTQAARWYRRGLDAAATLNHGYADEPAELAVAIAGIRFRQGRYQDCWEAASPVADDLTSAVKARFRAHYLMQLAGTYLRHPDTERHAVRAQELVDGIDDAVLASGLYNNLGIAAYYAGEWDRAVDLYEQSYQLRLASGDLAGMVSSLNNIGEVRADQRRYAEAEEMLEEAHRRSTAAGYEVVAQAAALNLGRLAGRRGDVERARELLSGVLEAAEATNAQGYVVESRLRLVEIEPPGPQMVGQARELLRLSERIGGGVTIDVPARRLLAVGLHASEDASALAEVTAAADAARAEQLDYELVLCLEALAQIASDRSDAEGAAAAIAEAADYRQRLGVMDG
ncbi:MAG: adenylate/guanylate cyclase domain-containing protein [Actinomycetota bacterium]